MSERRYRWAATAARGNGEVLRRDGGFTCASAEAGRARLDREVEQFLADAQIINRELWLIKAHAAAAEGNA